MCVCVYVCVYIYIYIYKIKKNTLDLYLYNSLFQLQQTQVAASSDKRQITTNTSYDSCRSIAVTTSICANSISAFWSCPAVPIVHHQGHTCCIIYIYIFIYQPLHTSRM